MSVATRVVPPNITASFLILYSTLSGPMSTTCSVKNKQQEFYGIYLSFKNGRLHCKQNDKKESQVKKTITSKKYNLYNKKRSNKKD